MLLVANENEILKYCDSQPDENGKTNKVPDEKTEMYLKAKEKTISDTVFFKGDMVNAIKNIICSFNNESLNRFKSRDNVTKIDNIMLERNNYNLRSFRYACQKTVDIFEKLKISEYYLLKTIFMGNIVFSRKIKGGTFSGWDGDDCFSTKLGTDDYPLFKFCYDYIETHWIDIAKAKNNIHKYNMIRLYNKNNFINDKDLKIVFLDYKSDYNKNLVNSALRNIEQCLCDYGDLSFYCYELLAYHLIILHSVLGFDYSLCQERMINNILTQKLELDSTPFAWSVKKFFLKVFLIKESLLIFILI